MIMANTDVVKHDLTTALRGAQFNWDEPVDPVPFPRGRQGGPSASALVGTVPPVTTLVTDEERVTAPFRSVGKMILVISGAKKGASGWVVARKAFITAGHCVFHPDYGGWITQAGFAPRYNNRADTSFTVTSVYSLKGWVDSKLWAYDLAACVVTENFADTEPPLAYNTGIIPALKDTAIGYPIRPIAGHDFNGKRMWKSVGKLVDLKNDLQYATNNFTGGSSGGPWCDNDDKFQVTGLTSNRGDDANVAESPTFDNGFQNLYNAIKDF
jgi:V8-like Glu-specific endopeptidase